MAAQYPQYEVFIDWDGDGGLRVSDFEQNYEGWEGLGTTPPDLSLSDDFEPYSGTTSLKIDWIAYNPFKFNNINTGFDNGRFGVGGFENMEPSFTFNTADKGFDEGRFAVVEAGGEEFVRPLLRRTFSNLFVGKVYRLSMWVYVPSTNGNHVRLEIEDDGTTEFTTAEDEWAELALTFTAEATSHVAQVVPFGALLAGFDDNVTYLDYVFITTQFEDITEEVLAKRSSVSFGYGRNSNRSLSPVEPGETELEVLNREGMYSLENEASPLNDFLRPGRETLVRAKHNSRAYDLFRGFVDDMNHNPGTGVESVTFQITDALAFLGQKPLSTAVHKGLRTGDAVGIILDYAGWPAHKRDIDAGASVIAWWWEEGSTVADALKKVVATEGGPAYMSVSPSGDFVFRDRHHRLLNSSSTSIQATFTAGGDEPQFSAPMDINVGWKDIVNVVEFNLSTTSSVFTPEPYVTWPVVWETEETFTLSQGEEKVFDVVASSAFVNAQTPRTGFTGEETDINDYEMISGAITVSLSRTSGARTELRVRCTSGPAVVKGMKLRASPLSSNDAVKISSRDAGSIGKVGESASTDMESGWANENDAQAIADVTIGIRANRLPTVSVDMNNASQERVEQILGRDLSDRIHILEPRSFTDHDYYIEHISHTISEAGMLHKTTFGCERVPTYSGNPFRFDGADGGFDEGVFGYDGLSEPETLFVLDQSNLDEGLLGL